MMEFGELDQFLLIRYLEKIVSWHKNFEGTNNPYNNLIMVQGNRPDVTFNRILNCDKDVYTFFNNLNSIQKATMMPKLELYYMTKEGYKLINFRNFPDFDEFRNFATNTKKNFLLKKDKRKKMV